MCVCVCTLACVYGVTRGQHRCAGGAPGDVASVPDARPQPNTHTTHMHANTHTHTHTPTVDMICGKAGGYMHCITLHN